MINLRGHFAETLGWLRWLHNHEFEDEGRTKIEGYCPQYFSNFQVASSSDPKKTYMVHFTGSDGLAICTCPAFRYSGDYGQQNCKHVDLVWTSGCFYNPRWNQNWGPNDLEDMGIKIISTDRHTIEEKCPGCGELMIPVRSNV